MKEKTLKRFRRAVYHLDHRKVRKLLRKRPALASAMLHGLPAIHVAAARDSVRLLDALLEAGADIDARDFDDNSPLHCAAFFNSRGAVSTLLAAGCDPNATNEAGATALHRAAARANPLVITLLLAGGADPHLRDGDGETPMAVALRGGDEKTIDALAQHAQALLPETGSDIAVDVEDSLAEWLDLFDADDEDDEAELDEPEPRLLPARYKVEFAPCDWCGASVMVGDATVTVNRNAERVTWNGDLEREEIHVDESEALLVLCASCGGKLNVPALRDFLSNSPTARESP